MKVHWGNVARLNAVGLVATPGEIDGFPMINNLVVDAAPATLTADRLAVASVLSFHRYLSGQLLLDQPMSALTAKTISEFLSPRWIHVSPVHPSNLPIPRGQVTLFLSPEGNSSDVPEDIDLTMEVTRRDRASGVQSGGDRISVGSNAWMHAEGDPMGLEYYFPFLAVAVIFSEDLQIDKIVLPAGLSFGAKMRPKLQNLLACAGIGLEVDA